VRVLRGYLEAAGFQVTAAYDGTEALAAFRHQEPDLIVLDLALPELDGLDVARAIRRKSEVPIIMLTARVDEADRLIGLELGADDYVPKPFSPREVVARVRAVLRRTGGSGPVSRTLSAGDITLDVDKRQAIVCGQPVELTPSEFDLLAALVESPGRVFSRMQLLDRLQGYAYQGYERTIDTHVKNLRQKIEQDPRHPRYILTIYGLGYKLAEPADA
jgi:two-component system alkaline phosphatase synthesis response regulator PhoP